MMIDTGSDTSLYKADNFTELKPHSIDFKSNILTCITKEHVISQATANLTIEIDEILSNQNFQIGILERDFLTK